MINGSYFLPGGSPQTPLRMDGRAAGPARYTSIHGAFVAGANDDVAILDLKGKDVLAAIAPFPAGDGVVSAARRRGRRGARAAVA